MHRPMDKKFFHLHLISDSTGETVNAVSRSALAQFEGIEVEEHIWSLVRTQGQLEKVIARIKEKPGFVMFTISDKFMRNVLKEACRKLNVPCISILSRVISDLTAYLGVKTTVHQPGQQHQLDAGYFSRVEAVNFALSHDDGQSLWDLEEAEIVLVGASRTSKSPTCVYLAFRGYRVANVPFVMGVPLPEIIFELKTPLVVGLTVSPDRLVQIRKNRLLSIKVEDHSPYVDMELVEKELIEVRKIFNRQGWPIIDVTRRSVEETAASIIQLMEKRKK